MKVIKVRRVRGSWVRRVRVSWVRRVRGSWGGREGGGGEGGLRFLYEFEMKPLTSHSTFLRFPQRRFKSGLCPRLRWRMAGSGGRCVNRGSDPHFSIKFTYLLLCPMDASKGL